jgi:hypothetical protein
MINNNSTMTRSNKMSSNAYAGLMNNSKAQDYAFYRHIRARLLQQSALYLGADLSDSNVLSLCFRDVPVFEPQASK